MPDNRQVGNSINAVSGSSNASPDSKIEESMWRLKIQDIQEEGEDNSNPYPDRPGEPDCIYYLRTGVCGYGSNCRYNHPSYTGQGTYRGDLPERVGQPDCLYFLKTGTCKFGATCKYHHLRDRHDSGKLSLNSLGLPLRPEEKPCQYYLRTGACKFGIACKFNHPQPTTVGTMLPMSGPSTYTSTGSSLASPSGVPVIGGLSPWSFTRPPYMSSPRMAGPSGYMPIILPSSQGIVPGQQGWSTYMSTMTSMSASDALGHGQISDAKASGLFPERPEQPECQYYMKTGTCKYGPSCKYHHPKERLASSDVCTIGPLGLPLRPGHPVCTFYSTYGSCKYGMSCKFDHPYTGYYNYSLPAIPITDPSAFYPYQRSSPSLVGWMPSETMPTKGLKLPDGLQKPETPANNVENIDTNAPEDPPPQDSPSQTAPSLGSPAPQEQSE